MNAEDIIDYHMKKQKAKEEGLVEKICPKCKNEMISTGRRMSGNVNYNIWKCKKCSNEVADLIGLAEESMKTIEKNNEFMKKNNF